MTVISSWSELFEKRSLIKSVYPEIWDISIVKKETDLLRRLIRNGTSILEVGAGDRRYEHTIKKIAPAAIYKGLDIDRKTRQEYYDIDDIHENFDFIFMFEVIEHLSKDEAVEMLKKVYTLLNNGGTLLLSTPNLYHPNRYYQDITHKTPFRYEDLGAIMLMAGFNSIKFYRMYNDDFFRRIFRLYLGIFIHKYIEVDFARTILAEGRKS